MEGQASGVGILVFMTACFVVLAVVLSRLYKVEDGNAGVVVRMGRVVGHVGPGLHYRGFGQRVYKVPSIRLVYPGGNRKMHSTAFTRDGLPVNFEGLVHYKVSDPALFVKNYMLGVPAQRDFGQYKHGEHLKSQFTAALRALTNPMDFASVLSGGVTTEGVAQQINRTMTDLGIEVLDVTIESIEPPQEFQETARRIVEQKARTEYLRNLSDVMKGESDKLIELLYVTESSDGGGEKSAPIREKIRKRRLAEAETESYKRLTDEVGPELARKIRELQALERSEDKIVRKEDFE